MKTKNPFIFKPKKLSSLEAKKQNRQRTKTWNCLDRKLLAVGLASSLDSHGAKK